MSLANLLFSMVEAAFPQIPTLSVSGLAMDATGAWMLTFFGFRDEFEQGQVHDFFKRFVFGNIQVNQVDCTWTDAGAPCLGVFGEIS